MKDATRLSIHQIVEEAGTQVTNAWELLEAIEDSDQRRMRMPYQWLVQLRELKQMADVLSDRLVELSMDTDAQPRAKREAITIDNVFLSRPIA